MLVYKKGIRAQQAVLMSIADMMSELLLLTCSHARVQGIKEDSVHAHQLLALQTHRSGLIMKAAANDIIASLPFAPFRFALRVLSAICLAGPRISKFKLLDNLGEKLVNEGS
jgi:hypothetical protein